MIPIVPARSDRLELLLLRHADAGDSMAWTRPDAERPLSPKGHRQSARVARWLVAIDHRPDAIISSPKVRAAETAAAVADAFGMAVLDEPRLAGPLGIDVLEDILRDAGRPARPILVGHDPDFSELAALLTGALVRIDIAARLEPGGGTLRWLVPPDALPGD